MQINEIRLFGKTLNLARLPVSPLGHSVGSTETRNKVILRAASTFVNARPHEYAPGQKQIAHRYSRKVRLASGWQQRLGRPHSS